MKLSKRKRNKIARIVLNTRINKNFFKFSNNLRKWLFFDYKSEKDIPHPTNISLELTNKCNLKCTMCPREHKFGKDLVHGNMDTDLACKIIDQNYPYLQSVGLVGLGESLFATNLVEVAKYIKSKKKSIVIFISTNANFPDFTERISPALPYLDTIQISIDGTQETYEKIRVGGSYTLFLENLKKLVELIKPYHIDLMFNMVVSKQNYTEMSAIIELAAELGIPFVNFNYLNLACIPEEDVSYYDFFRTDEFKTARELARSTARKYPDIEVTGLEDFDDNWVGKCHLVWNHFQINYDGEVPPCCGKPFSKELSFGNVKKESLMEVLNSQKAKKFRKSWETKIQHPFCNQCHLSFSAGTSQ